MANQNHVTEKDEMAYNTYGGSTLTSSPAPPLSPVSTAKKQIEANTRRFVNLKSSNAVTTLLVLVIKARNGWSRN